jgi:glycosyltransferase involved in cell wall biosynthesis
MAASLCAVVVVKNEEARIEECLSRLVWADEIVIVDNHSTDRTVELCRKYTQKIIASASPFTGIRVNCGIEHASCEWILNVDADEIVTDELRFEIQERLTTDAGRFSAYSFPVQHHFMNRRLRYGGWYPCYTRRLYRKGRAAYAVADHHVQVSVDGEVGYLRTALIHRAPQTIDRFISKMNLYTSNAAREHYLHRRASWFDLILKPPLIFIKRYYILGGFLDGFPGFVVAHLMAWYVFTEKAKLKEARYTQGGFL